MGELSPFLRFLENPSSHAITLTVGFALCYVFVARPLLARYDKLHEKFTEMTSELERALRKLIE